MRGNPTKAREIGQRIRSLRTQRGWTQQRLADRSGLHAIHISHLERGIKMPSVDTLAKLATALRVTLDHLAGRSK